jgi:hypothetical protein
MDEVFDPITIYVTNNLSIHAFNHPSNQIFTLSVFILVEGNTITKGENRDFMLIFPLPALFDPVL